MDWEYFLLFVLVLAQMLRTNQTLTQMLVNIKHLTKSLPDPKPDLTSVIIDENNDNLVKEWDGGL